MSDALIRELGAILGGRVFPGLLQERGGFHARRGIGTYESFLRSAGLRPPQYFLPGLINAERRAFQDACLVKARAIVHQIDRSGGFEGATRAEVVNGPCTLHRVVNQTQDGDPAGAWGAWWFSDEVLREVAERSRRRGAQILGGQEYKAQLRENLRRALALRVDWNSMVYLCSMKLIHGSFPAIRGVGSAQPAWTPAPTERLVPETLRGGYEQIWLPWTPPVMLDLTQLS